MRLLPIKETDFFFCTPIGFFLVQITAFRLSPDEAKNGSNAHFHTFH